MHWLSTLWKMHWLSTLWISCGQAVQCKQNYAQKISRLHEMSVASERRSFDHIRARDSVEALLSIELVPGPQGSPRGASGEERGRRLQTRTVRSPDGEGREAVQAADECTDRRILGFVRSHGLQGFRAARSGGSSDPGGVRSALRSTRDGPCVHAPGASSIAPLQIPGRRDDWYLSIAFDTAISVNSESRFEGSEFHRLYEQLLGPSPSSGSKGKRRGAKRRR